MTRPLNFGRPDAFVATQWQSRLSAPDPRYPFPLEDPTPAVKIETLTDDFETGVLDSAKWIFDGSYDGSPGLASASDYDITSGVARLKPTDTFAFDSDGRFRSVTTNYSILGSSVYGKFWLDGSLANTEFSFFVTAPADDTNYCGFTLSQGTFYQIGQDSGSLGILNSGTTYDAVAHAWWRIAIALDGTIDFDVAADASGSPGTWTTIWTAATSALPWLAAADSVRLLLKRKNVGALASTAEGVVNIDGINTATAPAGGAAINASAAVVEGADQFTAAATVAAAASASLREGQDLDSAAATVATVASAGLLEGQDRDAAAAAIALATSAGVIEGQDQDSAAAGVTVGASSGVIEGADRDSAAAAIALAASASEVEGADQFAAQAAAALAASAAEVEGQDQFAAAAAAALAASSALLENPDNLASDATTIAGAINASSALLEGQDQDAAAATSAIVASASVQESPDAFAAATGAVVAASAAIVEGADRTATAAGNTVGAAASLLEGADQTATSSTSTLTANAALLEGADQVGSAGAAAVVASAAVQEGADQIDAQASTLGVVFLNCDAAILEGQDSISAGATIAPLPDDAFLPDGEDPGYQESLAQQHRAEQIRKQNHALVMMIIQAATEGAFDVVD